MGNILSNEQSVFKFRGMLLRPGVLTRAGAYLTEWGWRGECHEWRYAGPDGKRHGPFNNYDGMVEHYIANYLPQYITVVDSSR